MEASRKEGLLERIVFEDPRGPRNKPLLLLLVTVVVDVVEFCCARCLLYSSLTSIVLSELDLTNNGRIDAETRNNVLIWLWCSRLSGLSVRPPTQRAAIYFVSWILKYWTTVVRSLHPPPPQSRDALQFSLVFGWLAHSPKKKKFSSQPPPPPHSSFLFLHVWSLRHFKIVLSSYISQMLFWTHQISVNFQMYNCLIPQGTTDTTVQFAILQN